MNDAEKNRAPDYEAELAEHNKREAEWKRRKEDGFDFERITNPGEMAIEVARAIDLLADAIVEQNKMLNMAVAEIARLDRVVKQLEDR